VVAAAATTEICAVVSVIVDKAADLSERLRPAACRELELEERLDSSSLTTLPESEELELEEMMPSWISLSLKSLPVSQDEARNPISSAVANNFPSSELEHIAHSKVKTD
jgi:hypothetical protein